jgi:hypothetical protein
MALQDLKRPAEARASYDNLSILPRDLPSATRRSPNVFRGARQISQDRFYTILIM